MPDGHAQPRDSRSEAASLGQSDGSAEPCPWCPCPADEFDGHCCEDYQIRELITREHAFRAAQNAVRRQGYAVAVHGSLIRDLDLVAIPWQETAIDAHACAEIIAKAIPGVLLEPAEEKPYGRLAWEIHPLRSAGQKWGHGFDQWYVDLSVMPRLPDRGHSDAE